MQAARNFQETEWASTKASSLARLAPVYQGRDLPARQGRCHFPECWSPSCAEQLTNIGVIEARKADKTSEADDADDSESASN